MSSSTQNGIEPFISPKLPLVSIVTVVLNDVVNIEKTVESVISQIDCSFEYIVIDGQSTDGTLNVLSKYINNIEYLSSEKDGGIYFAMNKAIDVAKGQWMIFMNSGDVFASPDVLASIFEKNNMMGIDVIYGQRNICYGNGQVRREFPGKLKDIWKGMIFSHQSLLTRVEVLKKNKFNCQFKLASDYNLIARLYANGLKFCYVPIIISSISINGASDLNRSVVFNEYCEISSFYFPGKRQKIFFTLKLIDGVLRGLVKKCLPASLVRWFQL